MDLKELKAKHSDLYEAVKNEAVQGEQSANTVVIAAKDKEIADLTDKVSAAGEQNKELGTRVNNLEKKDIMRSEKDLKVSADSIVASELSKTKFSARIQEKIKGNIDYESFIADGKFDATAFAESVKAEVKDWQEIVGDSTSEPSLDVLGVSTNSSSNEDGKPVETEAVSEKVDSLAASLGIK